MCELEDRVSCKKPTWTVFKEAMPRLDHSRQPMDSSTLLSARWTVMLAGGGLHKCAQKKCVCFGELTPWQCVCGWSSTIPARSIVNQSLLLGVLTARCTWSGQSRMVRPQITKSKSNIKKRMTSFIGGWSRKVHIGLGKAEGEDDGPNLRRVVARKRLGNQNHRGNGSNGVPGYLLEVQLGKTCTRLWRDSGLEVENVEIWGARGAFWFCSGVSCGKHGDFNALCKMRGKRTGSWGF